MFTQIQDLKRKNYKDTLKIQERLRKQVLINSYSYWGNKSFNYFIFL